MTGNGYFANSQLLSMAVPERYTSKKATDKYRRQAATIKDLHASIIRALAVQTCPFEAEVQLLLSRDSLSLC